MRLDGARSATRRLLEGGTCATRVTRGTFDFQEGDGLELRAGMTLEIVGRMRASRRGICKEFFRCFSSAQLDHPASSHLSSAKPSKLLSKQVSRTRRTRRTPQLKSSAQLHHLASKHLSIAQLHPLRIHHCLGTITPIEGRMAYG